MREKAALKRRQPRHERRACPLRIGTPLDRSENGRRKYLFIQTAKSSRNPGEKSLRRARDRRFFLDMRVNIAYS